MPLKLSLSKLLLYWPIYQKISAQSSYSISNLKIMLVYGHKNQFTPVFKE